MTDSIRERVIGLGRAVGASWARGRLRAATSPPASHERPDVGDAYRMEPRRPGRRDLVQVSLDGRRLEGAMAPTSELLLHLGRAPGPAGRQVEPAPAPAVATLLHGSTSRSARSRPTTRSICAIATVPYLHPGSAELAKAAAAELAAGADVVLLRHHGCVVVGDTPDLALSRAVNLEAAAEATYRARLLGDHSAECPPQFLEHVLGEEARGRRYGLRQ